jgi:hypothetical protein
MKFLSYIGSGGARCKFILISIYEVQISWFLPTKAGAMLLGAFEYIIIEAI